MLHRHVHDLGKNGCKPSASSAGTRVASTNDDDGPLPLPTLRRLGYAVIAAACWLVALVAAAAFVVSQ